MSKTVGLQGTAQTNWHIFRSALSSLGSRFGPPLVGAQDACRRQPVVDRRPAEPQCVGLGGKAGRPGQVSIANLRFGLISSLLLGPVLNSLHEIQTDTTSTKVTSTGTYGD